MKVSGVASAHVDVPLEQTEAFEAFTSEIGDWYVIDRFTVPDPTAVRTVRLEAGVGGRLVYVTSAGGDGETVGRIVTWEPPRRFVFVDGRDLEVTITFDALAGGCRVTVEERGLDNLAPDVARTVRRHSWHRYLPTWFHDHITRRTDS